MNPNPVVSEQASVRVVVAEDSLLVREGIATLLSHQVGVEVVAMCEDLDSLLAAVVEHDPDVVLTDIRMPPSGTDEGIRAAASLRTSHPDVGVVVLSHFAEPAYAIELLDGGSSGRAYLLKDRLGHADELIAAIWEVNRGGSVVDPKIVEALVASRRRVETSPLERLTVREGEVLAEIAAGKNNAGVAHALGLTERAVQKHINSFFAKLGLGEEPDVHRRVKAVLMYLSAAEGG